MALIFSATATATASSPSSSSLLIKPHLQFKSPLISFPPSANRRFPRLQSSISPASPEPEPKSDPSSAGEPPSITDEWGEKSGAEGTANNYYRFSDSDPPKEEQEDEWGADAVGRDGAAPAVNDKVGELKRCLVDTVYGSDLGFRASPEVRAEVLELVNQLEAANPTPAPVEASGLLDGNWVLVYTAFSELLPLIAAGNIPLLKLDKICQSIDSGSLTIVNSATLSSPFASFSFSASAAFEVRSPSRIQVEFKEGTFQPPEIKPRIDLPNSVSAFGQNIDLMPIQQSLGPLQETVASLSRAISGQPPLKLPIPGNRAQSWLLITYLDDEMRISRGDGGLFVLVKEGSPLLN
ncbi:hypothetical protein SAY86_027508 [Trapa natans]|uniref:Plastid lipid-associated protein/fibrillin conserved domain-containing protein n=1 Tax=Trapa natans TaxID=22666 RepID=A0AAN7KRJ5_TRANT|nr:hypothetical protein SAY86_027508 [Trapa natans]